MTVAVLTVRTEPTAEASLAAIRDRRRFGIAIAAMINIIATTISNSISENPRFYFDALPRNRDSAGYPAARSTLISVLLFIILLPNLVGGMTGPGRIPVVSGKTALPQVFVESFLGNSGWGPRGGKKFSSGERTFSSVPNSHSCAQGLTLAEEH